MKLILILIPITALLLFIILKTLKRVTNDDLHYNLSQVQLMINRYPTKARHDCIKELLLELDTHTWERSEENIKAFNLVAGNFKRKYKKLWKNV